MSQHDTGGHTIQTFSNRNVLRECVYCSVKNSRESTARARNSDGPKHGASYSPDSSGTMDLAKCFLACNADSQCDGITVNWKEAGLVDCYLRGGIDPKKCEKTPKGTYSTFTKD